MATLLRVLISVTPAAGGWVAACSCPSVPTFSAQRRLVSVPVLLPAAYEPVGFPRPHPDEPDLPPEGQPHYALCVDPDTAALAATYDRIVSRQPAPGDVVAFGRYLFDTLIGPANWAAIRALAEANAADVLDVALAWAASEVDLHRLNWEMMRGPDAFLAGFQPHDPKEIAITRLVLPDPGMTPVVPPQPSAAVPRKLFVIGTDLNDQAIRPGAEFMALLRRLKHNHQIVHTRVLRRASPQRLMHVIQTYQPDVVHFICHGDIDAEGRGYLQLTIDDEDAGPAGGVQETYADDLVTYLSAGPHRPTVVVLSACQSGATAGGATAGGAAPSGLPAASQAADAEPGMMLGAHRTAPLAAELVKRGIPIVIGMAGRIADSACRHFTRRFGEAVVQREPLVKATAEGRRAAFVHGPEPTSAVDWAFPALFTARDVPADYVLSLPVTPTPLDALSTQYDLYREPIFCGRYDCFETYYRLVDPNELPAVEVVVGGAGRGKTRLLQELTLQALRDGHLPLAVIIDTDSRRENAPQEGPKTLEEFRRLLTDTLLFMRSTLQLPVVRPRLLDLLKPERLETTDPDLGVRMENQGGQLTLPLIFLALARDLEALLDDTRVTHPELLHAQSRPLVLLDALDQYGDDVLQDFVPNKVLGPNGLKEAAAPIPVILACAPDGAAAHLLDALVDTRDRGWLRRRVLEPFSSVADQDLLAYGQVWLNPAEQARNQPAAGAGATGRPLALNDQAQSNPQYAQWRQSLIQYLRGEPRMLTNEMFYAMSNFGCAIEALVDADDETLLDKYLGGDGA